MTEWDELPNGQKYRIPEVDPLPYKEVALEWPAWDNGEVTSYNRTDSLEPNKWYSFSHVWGEDGHKFYLDDELIGFMTNEEYDSQEEPSNDRQEGQGSSAS